MASSAKEYHAKRERERRAFEQATVPVEIQLKKLVATMLDGHRYLVKNLIRIETNRLFTTPPVNNVVGELERLKIAEGSSEVFQDTPSSKATFRDAKSHWAGMTALSMADVTPKSWETTDWAVDRRKWPQETVKDHSALNTLEKGTFQITTFGKKKPPGSQSKSGPADRKVTIPAKNISKTHPVQKYSDYITLKSNIVTEDDENMRYVPYFGEDIDTLDQANFQEEMKEAYVDKTLKNEWDARTVEKANQFSAFFGELLKNSQIAPLDLKYYLLGKLPSEWSEERKRMRAKALPEDFDPDQSVTKDIASVSMLAEHVLARAEAVAHVFKSVTKLSIWDVLKIYGNDDIAPIITSPVKQAQPQTQSLGESSAPFSLESYHMLACPFCGVHECPWHDNKVSSGSGSEMPGTIGSGPGAQPATHKRNAAKKTTSKTQNLPLTNPDGLLMENGAERQDDPVLVNSSFTPQQKTLILRTTAECWDKDVPCSEGCFVTNPPVAAEDRAQMVSGWTEDQITLFNSSAANFRYNSRCACILACIIHRPCHEIHARLKREKVLLDMPSDELALALSNSTLENGSPANGMRSGGANKKATKADFEMAAKHHERSYFKPCNHPGLRCSSGLNCPCVRLKIHCEKFCHCAADCHRRWRGCNCASGKQCGKGKCACHIAGRECDPDLCRNCGADEQLDPANRTDEDIAKNCCQNVPMQKGIPIKTLLGKTLLPVNGYGLFTGHDVKKDTFLGEYKGEVITENEAERRGKVYDKRKVSFLFNVNQTHVIDATRAGNKFRFVNHWSKKPNTYARVFIVNGIHRIGMFARQDIPAGVELFFDYGYSNKTVKFVAEEPPDPKAGNAKPTTKRKKGGPEKVTSKRTNGPTPPLNKLKPSRQNSASTAQQSDSEAEGSVAARSSRIRWDLSEDQESSSRLSSDQEGDGDVEFAVDNDDSDDGDFGTPPSSRQRKRVLKKRRVQ